MPQRDHQQAYKSSDRPAAADHREAHVIDDAYRLVLVAGKPCEELHLAEAWDVPGHSPTHAQNALWPLRASLVTARDGIPTAHGHTRFSEYRASAC